MSWLRYLKILSYFLYAVFKVHIWPTSLLLHQSSELWIFCKLSKLWSLVKPAYHNSTSLLIGLAAISCCSSLPVSMIKLFSRQRICLFLFLIWRPPTLPHRLQCSTIGRLGLNRRVRDGYGCVPQTHRHQNVIISFWQLDNSTIDNNPYSLPF